MVPAETEGRGKVKTMKSEEIIKLLEILIGETKAMGDSALDEKVEHNLKVLIDVTDWCLEGVARASETRHRPEYSMQKIGERAFKALYEWRDWLEVCVNTH